MGQFFLKSVLSLSLSVGALSASTNSTDQSDLVAPSASSSTTSTSLTVVKDENHPAARAMAFFTAQKDAEGNICIDTQGNTITVDVGFWNHPRMAHLQKQEIVSYLDPRSVYNFYRAGYINKWMWNALSGDTEFLAGDIRQKLFLVALAIQTKDPQLFLQDQTPYFGRLSNTHLLGLFNSHDLSRFLVQETVTRAKYNALARGEYNSLGESGENLRLIPPQGLLRDNWVGFPRTSVYFLNNKLTDVSVLEDAPSLTHIEIGHNQLVALPNLAVFPGLQELKAGRNRLETVTGLGQQTNLRLLVLDRNRLTQISGLEGLVGLEHLHLAHNNLEGGLDLRGLTKLFSLSLKANRISEITGLDQLPCLNSVTLSGNPISSLPFLSRLGQLDKLKLNRTGFTSLGSLAGLTQLQVCDLSGNGLTSIDDLPAFPKVWKLLLDNNRLRSAESLTRMTSLIMLGLSNNDFESLESLNGIPLLSWLYIGGNTRLTSLNTLHTSAREKLKSIHIQGLPLVSMDPLMDMRLLENLVIDENQWPDLKGTIEQGVAHLRIQGRGPNVDKQFMNGSGHDRVISREAEREPAMPMYSDFMN